MTSNSLGSGHKGSKDELYLEANILFQGFGVQDLGFREKGVGFRIDSGLGFIIGFWGMLYCTVITKGLTN